MDEAAVSGKTARGRAAPAPRGGARDASHRLHLSQRLLFVTLAATLPIAFVLVFNLVALRRSMEAELHAGALRQAQVVALEISGTLEDAQGLLRAITAAPVVRRGDVAACHGYLTDVLPQLPQFAALAVTDATGVVRCAARTRAPIALGDRDYVRAALDTGRPAVGAYTLDRISGTPVLPLAAPLAPDVAWEGGVAVAAVDLAWVGRWLRDHRLPEGASITIADRDGRILAREPQPERFVGTLIPDAYQHLVRAEAPGTLVVTSQDGTRRILGYVPAAKAPEGVYVSAGLSVARGFAALDAAVVKSVLIGAAGVAAAAALGWWTSAAFIRRPFRRIVGTIAAWRRGDTGARTGMAEGGELGEVGRAIDDFLDALAAAEADRRRGEAQRELLMREMTHRAKNLLASIQAIARRSFRDAGPGSEADAFLRRVALLGAAHDLLTQDERQRASVRRLVDTAIAPFADPADAPFEIAGPDLVLNAPTVLALGLALHELCTNAAKYGALRAPAGRVAIRWDVEGSGAGARFRLVWRERGGPRVAAPAARGFGSRLIEQALARQIGGEATLRFEADGLVCVVEAPLADVREAEPPATQQGTETSARRA